jgi:hypothetical protein
MRTIQVVGSIPSPVRMLLLSPEESSGLRNGILHRNLPRRRRNPVLTMYKPGPHNSIYFPSKEAFILRHPVCEAESGFDFCISVYTNYICVRLLCPHCHPPDGL